MMGSTSHSTDDSALRAYTIRDGETLEDMFYLRWQWEHYFGTHCQQTTELPAPLAEIVDLTDDDGPPLAACAPIAEHDGVPVGGGVAELVDHDAAVESMPATGRFNRVQLAGERNAWLNLGVVDPAWRGQGIGRDLFRHRLQWAAAQDADMVFGYGWERDDGRDSRPLFEGHGFTPIQQLEHFYATEGDRDSCPDCGIWASDDDVCQCETTFWALDGGTIDV